MSILDILAVLVFIVTLTAGSIYDGSRVLLAAAIVIVATIVAVPPNQGVTVMTTCLAYLLGLWVAQYYLPTRKAASGVAQLDRLAEQYKAATPVKRCGPTCIVCHGDGLTPPRNQDDQ